jgi:N-acetylneuraminic acid mutarotase
MSNYLIKSETLTSIADAIRAKGGSSAPLNPTDMATAIDQIEGDCEDYTGEITVTPDTSTELMTFNIAYGETAPEDTSKLWVKCEEPSSVEVTSKVIVTDNELDSGIGVLPVKPFSPAYAAVGSNIYIFGGYDSNTSSNISPVIMYDSETNNVTTLSTTLPIAATSIAAAAVGTKIYLFGGYYYNKDTSTGVNLGTINVFDTTDNTITTLSTTLKSSAYDIAAAAVGTKIYLFGGHIYSSYGNGSWLSSITVFDTETKSISTLNTSIPVEICGLAAAAVGTKIYLFGGTCYGRTWVTNSQKYIFVFDTEDNSIRTSSTSLPTYAHYIGAAAISTKIYLFGGHNSVSGGYLTTINEFDCETELITTLNTSLPYGLYSMAVAPIGTKIYILGGNDSDEIHEFVVKLPLATNTLLLEASGTKNMFNLMANSAINVEVGINNVYIGDSEGYAEKVPALLSHIERGIEGEYPNSNCVETSAGTELSASIDCAVGDLIVASIITRDTLTVSDGWTLLSTSEINSTDTTNGQRLSWAYKFAENESESITVTQASEQRLYINMVALTGATGVIDNGYTYEDSEVSTITVPKPSGLTIWACSAPMWDSTIPCTQWEISNGSYRIDLGNTTQSRLAIFLDQSDSESVTFVPGNTSLSTVIIGSLTVEGIDRLYTEHPFTRNVWKEI